MGGLFLNYCLSLLTYHFLKKSKMTLLPTLEDICYDLISEKATCWTSRVTLALCTQGADKSPREKSLLLCTLSLGLIMPPQCGIWRSFTGLLFQWPVGNLLTFTVNREQLPNTKGKKMFKKKRI